MAEIHEPSKIHNSVYSPEAHPDLCYCGFEQCESRKNRLLRRNSQPERMSKKNVSPAKDTSNQPLPLGGSE